MCFSFIELTSMDTNTNIDMMRYDMGYNMELNITCYIMCFSFIELTSMDTNTNIDMMRYDMELNLAESGASSGGSRVSSIVTLIYVVYKSIRTVVFSNKLNLLLPFGPAAILVQELTDQSAWVFFLSLVGIAPLAERLGYATEQLAFYTGPTVGGLLNATFGNATELIISIFALKSGLIRIVQLSLLGAILSDLLLVLGCAFFCGGLVLQKEQLFNKATAVVNSGLLLVAVMGLLLPTVLHYTHTEVYFGKSELALSRFSSCIMLVTYAAYLYFQLKSQRNLYVPLNEVYPFLILEKYNTIELDNFQGRDMGGEEEDQESPLLGSSSQPDEPEEPLKRTGTTWTSIAYIITGVIGAGVLSLAWSVAQLGWIAGPLLMIVFAGITIISTNLLCDCYRYPDPECGPARIRSYMEAVRVYLGEKSQKVSGVIVLESLWGGAVAYVITAATSMRAIQKSNCYHKEGHQAPCAYGDTFYMLLFGLVQIVMSQIPDFHKMEWLSVVAAMMSFTYSFIGIALGFAKVIGC
nr:vacuolar cation/proton exchanger 5 [Quercus suber]